MNAKYALVPVEVVGHYNIVPLLLDDSPLKFNVDLGLGSERVTHYGHGLRHCF